MIKKIVSYVAEFKKASILTPTFVALEVVMEVLIPLLMARLIDYGIDAGDMDYIIKMGAVLVVACVFSLAFGVLAGKYGAEASAGLGKNLRRAMYYKVQEYSFANIDKFSTSSIVTRLTTDVTNVQMSYLMIIRSAVRCPLMLIFSLIMAFGINKELSLVFLGAIPVLAIGLIVIMKKTRPLFESMFRRYDRMNTVVSENLRGIRLVKAFVREKRETKKFKQVTADLYSDSTRAEVILMYSFPLMQFCIYACMLLISWIGARLIVGGSMTTGELTGVISYAMQILMSLMIVSVVFVMITMSRASANRIVEILDEESDITNPENPVMEVESGEIEFKDVSFSYYKREDKLALKDINIDIKSGETIGVIGSTGCGKTTLVSLISRLYDVTKGQLKVGGRDVKEYDIKVLRDAVSVVLQKNELFSGTIKENLRWGKEDATDEEIIEVCKLAQASEFIEKFTDGYDTYIEQGGNNVSGGQKQRLCIARALLKRPKILILDDSTSAVDTKTDSLIRESFAKKIPDTTKIIIAQRISSVQDADRIIVLDDGKINGVGSHDELLLNNEIYREVYMSQQKGGDMDEQ